MTKTDASQPADTRMMNIVHQALRRDLQRAATALELTPPPGERQRVAIADHLGWMMEFLRGHHESEDVGLYPVVRARRPDAADLLDQMDDDHQTIARSIDAVDLAASTYGATDEPSARTRLVAALGDLDEVLLPHLQREEELVLPIAAAALTDAEWQAIEHEHNVKHKTIAQLGREGHWLIDDASAADRETVLGLVPAVPRFALLHGYGPIYRRQRDACWLPSTAAPRRVQKHGHNEVFVAADPDAVWKVVLDLTRVGEWSHECRGCSFLDGATRAEAGARFRGRNRQGLVRWGRVCEVLSTENRELVWRTVPTKLYPDSSIWRIRVTEADAGTRLEQSFDVVRTPGILDVVYATMIPAHRDRAAALTDDLRRLGELAHTATDRSVTAV
jgi:iron-sulfur cluster repair protein YtfE (RIC family)